ncbi:MAG: hypothetical protein HYU36_13305 [Planctomycetes bacterium]|nr:hypothetical protein [Planctomycetota bacterium]
MNPTWAARIPVAAAHAAAGLRLHPSIRACEDHGFLWLSGEAMDDLLDLALRKIPDATLYSVLPSGLLKRQDARIPKGKLPGQGWIPLQDWLMPETQPAALPGLASRRIPLRIIRSSAERDAGILVADWKAWKVYATRAPAARLKRLHFAASKDARAFIRGVPLPPIPGERYTDTDGIAVPCGWTLDPPVDASVARKCLLLAAGDVALFRPDGLVERIQASNFVSATRTAVRATDVASRHG